jgi:hypothetical protein
MSGYKRLEHDKIINELMSVLKGKPEELTEEQRAQLKELLEEKNEVEYLSKKEQEALDILSGAKKNRNRLLTLFGVSVVGAGLALAVSQKGDDQETSTVDRTKDEPEITEMVPESISEQVPPEVQEVQEAPQMPKVEFVNMPVQHRTPFGIECSQEEYMQAAAEFVYEVKTQLVPKLIRSFEMHPEFKAPTAQREKLFVHFMLAAIDTASKKSVFKPYINQQKDNTDMVEWANYIKPLFLAGGCYFEFKRDVATYDKNAGTMVGTTSLNIYAINGDEMVTVEDISGITGVSVLYLGDCLFDLDENNTIGQYDPESNFALIFEQNIKAKDRIDELIRSGVTKERPKNEAELIKQYRKNAIIHEATHVLIGKTLSLGRSVGVFQTYKVPVGVPLNNTGTVADASGIYTPVHFAELCAAGSEIYNDQSSFPLTYVMYFADHRNNFGYKLIGQLLPLLTVKAIPESPEKETLLAKMQSNQRMKSAELARIAIHQLTPELRRQVGAQMYRMGRQMFYLAESGQLENGSGGY